MFVPVVLEDGLCDVALRQQLQGLKSAFKLSSGAKNVHNSVVTG